MYGNNGRLTEAIALFERAIKANPDYVQSYNNLGVAYGKAGREDDALEYLLKAVEVDPSGEMGYWNLCKIYLQRKRYAEAAEYYEQAARMGFFNPELKKAIDSCR